MAAQPTQTESGEHASPHADPAAHAVHERAEHPSDWEYIKVAIILAIVTAIEVALYYYEIPGFNNYVLLILAVVKFVLVAGWFMHLRHDNPILRRTFIFGIVLALAVFAAYLFTFGWMGWF